jgi:hypothetical protein
MPRPSPKRTAISYCAAMSPATAAARNAGPPMAGGNASGESSGASIAALFELAGGAETAGIGRGGSEPVGSAAFGDGSCERGCGAGAEGVTAGAALGAIGDEAGGGLGTARDCGAGCGAAAGSAGELCDELPPVPPVPPAGAASGAALGAGTSSGVGADVAAAGDGSALPRGCKNSGCGDPLCGCAAFGFFSG